MISTNKGLACVFCTRESQAVFKVTGIGGDPSRESLLVCCARHLAKTVRYWLGTSGSKQEARVFEIALTTREKKKQEKL